MDETSKSPSVPVWAAQNPTPDLPFWRQLRWNLIMYFVALAVIPVAVVVAIVLPLAREQATVQTTNQLVSVAELKIAQITRWLEDSHSILHVFLSDPNREAQTTSLAQASLEPNDLTSLEPEQEAVGELLALTTSDQTFFEELFFYNTAGKIIAASDPGRWVSLWSTSPILSLVYRERNTIPRHLSMSWDAPN
ncbi:MAG: hypothetical protein HC875_02265 [Anaerolineales bacterium]|nr:hypothetical protein [Anaerolineales bacterium]